jgi:hypothetical protein
MRLFVPGLRPMEILKEWFCVRNMTTPHPQHYLLFCEGMSKKGQG